MSLNEKELNLRNLTVKVASMCLNRGAIPALGVISEVVATCDP